MQIDDSMIQNVHNQDEQCHHVKAFCVLLVFDSYNREFMARTPEINATLKTFVHTLVKEEVRDKFVGREAYKILKLRQSILKDVAGETASQK